MRFKNMEHPKFWIGVVIITWVLLNGLGWGHGCLDQDKEALLQLKPFFKHLSWPMNEEETSSDCCQWEMVECNVTTGRITNLYLSLMFKKPDIHVLNVSLFLPFEELKILDLSNNNIVGFVENQGFEILSLRLRKLEELYLRGNYFNWSSVSSLRGFSSLKSLSLWDNNISSSINSDGFGSQWPFSNLERLVLGENNLDNSILSSLRGFSSLKDLDLQHNRLSGTIDMQDLHNLTSLKKLDMSLNNIKDFGSFKGFGSQWPLRNLELLYLRANNLDNSILSSLRGFSSLKDLDLQDNRLSGTIDMQDIHNLTSLKKLDMSVNNIKDFGSFKGAHEGLLPLSSLNVLDLRGNLLNSSVFSSLNEFSQLKSLDLSSNQLTGSVNLKELEALRNLEELDISYNAAEKIVGPQDKTTSSATSNKSIELENIGYLTSLKVLNLKACGLKGNLSPLGLCELQNLQELHLSDNELTGTLPPCFANLTSIQTLDLSYNHFQVTFESFANYSGLKYFTADGNELIEETTSQPWTPKFQLEELSLSNPKNSRPKFPSFLYHQFNLEYLDLYGAKFGGAFPNWLFQNNTRLGNIYLVNNSFVGSFQFPSHPNLDMSILHISLNNLSGQIPSNISLIFPNLMYFLLSGNAFQGNIPLSLGEMESLQILDLSNNQFSGEIQVQFVNMTQLRTIKLSNNNFSRHIPTNFDPNVIASLQMDGNNFTGEIPDLSSLNSLSTLDISHNSLSGKLPRWIANMSSLTELVVSNNHFEGPIPPEFCKLSSLQFLDLSRNNFSGFIPSCFSELVLLAHVDMSTNMLTGPIPQSFVNITHLLALNLGDNNLNGPIPNWLGNLSSLGILLLQENHFNGDFPISLCHLNHLQILDLSSNDLNGQLPPCLTNLFSNITSMDSYKSFFDYRSSYFVIPDIHEVVEFTTKSNSLDYTGYILYHMYGIDLSCNRFSGEIPLKFGNFVRALNFSHNNLGGSIPTSFSNLKQLESLDLSFNELNGRIPFQLTQINTLAVFRVAHNNLSGPIPDNAQFGTFDESSYQGNPLLCGPPLNNSCDASPPEEKTKDNGFMDMTLFWATIGVTYVVTLFSVVSVLYINPYWRHAWFRLIDACFNTCYYFVLDNFH